MQGWARGLKARLLPANGQMQEAGSSYSKKLEELQHLMQIQESLSTTRQVICPGAHDGSSTAVWLMHECVVSHHVSSSMHPSFINEHQSALKSAPST